MKSRQSLGSRSRTPSSTTAVADACIKVACRVRPSLVPAVVTADPDADTILVKIPGYTQEQPEPYAFDCVFDQKCTQEDVYKKMAEPIVQDVLLGINGTVFCYGQSGSGKTYTMEGTEDDPGLLPRLGHTIFEGSDKPPEAVSVCFVEIYMEKLQDLLEPLNRVEVRETMSGNVYLANVCERTVSSSSELLRCVKDGQKNRSVAATKMNDRSSRSHSVFTVSVKSSDRVSGLPFHGLLHLVDLAGSESQGRTGAVGQTLEQSKYINQSLLGLGRVIGALGTGQPHVPYRDSKLTRILQDSLGGSARTSLVVNISPEAVNTYETISSLRFGQNASLVKNAPRVNLVDLTMADLRKLLSERDAEIARLRLQLTAFEIAPAPRNTEWIAIGTPEKTNMRAMKMSSMPEVPAINLLDGMSCLSEAPAYKPYLRVMACSLVVLILALATYATCTTNPDMMQEGFRQFLLARCILPSLHSAAEMCGLIKVRFWNIGLVSIGQENQRFFVGAFGQWLELPGVVYFANSGLPENHDVEALVFAWLLFYVLWQLMPKRLLPRVRAQQWLVNALFLHAVGPQAHSLLGRNRFFALFLVSGVCAWAGSIVSQHFLSRMCGPARMQNYGASGSLFALLAYMCTACHWSNHSIHLLGRDWDPVEFMALQLLLGKASGNSMTTSFFGGLAGWAAARWQLLSLVPTPPGLLTRIDLQLPRLA